MANYKEIMDKVRQDRFEQDVAKVDEEYLRRFSESAGSYLDSAKSQYDGLGYGNAYQSYLNRRDSYTDLDYRRRVIQEWSKRNPGSLDQQSTTFLDSFGRDSKGILDSFYNAKDFFSLFESEDAYNGWRRKEDFINQYLADPEKAMSAMDYEDGWLREAQYRLDSKVLDAKDFPGYSKYRSTMADSRWDKAWSQYSMGYNDLTYEFINNQNNIRDEILKKSLAIYSDSPFRNSKTVYEMKHYDFMTEEEVSIYNYYYAKEGKKRAEEYLDTLAGILEERSNQNTVENVSKTAREHPFLASVASVGTSLGSGFEFAGDALSFGIDKVMGKDARMGTNELGLMTNAVRGTVSDMVDWEIGNWDAFDFVYSTTMSGADSLTSGMLGGAGGLVLGLSAAAQGTNDALQRGMSSDKAFWNGLFSGVFEGLFESVSLGNFNKLKEVAPDSVKTIFKNIGKSMLVNASEETLTEIANIGYDTLMNGEFANYTWEDLKNGAWKNALVQVLESGASGALMGAGFGVTGNTIGYASGSMAAKQLYGADPGALVRESLEIDPENRFAQRMRSRVSDGKKLSGGQLMRLAMQNESAITAKDMRAIREAAKSYGDQAQAMIHTYQAGQDVEKYEAAYRNAFEMGRSGVNFDYVKGSKGASYLTEEQKELAYKAGVDAGKSGSDTASVQKIVAMENGDVTVAMEDGSQIQLEKAEMSPAEKTQIQAIANIEGITAQDADKILGIVRENSGKSAHLGIVDAKEAYRYGYYGYSQAKLDQQSDHGGGLTKSQRQTVYEIGRAARNATVQKRTQLLAESAVVAKNATTDQKATGKVHFDGDRAALTERQSTSLTAMEKIADVTGLQVHVFESKAATNGKRIGANGWYDPSDSSIHIDLHAGANGEGTMLFTLAHELTHHIRQWSPEKFKVLADFLMNEYGKADVDVDGLVSEQIRKAERNGRTISYDVAFEEVVADSMETMLSDGNVMKRLEKLKAQDKSLWQKIKRFIDELAAKIREIYKGLSPDSVEGRYVADMGMAVYKLQELFAEALAEASENYQGSIIPGEEGVVTNRSGDAVAYATDDGSVLLSMRTYEETGREAFRKYLQKCVKNERLTKAEMQDMLDGIEEIYETCKEFKDKYAPFSSWSDAAVVQDTHGRPVFSVVTPNGDYKMNLDFSLVCKKRRTLDAVFNEMSRRGIIDDFELGQKSVVKINEIIRKYGLETACALCFVDAKRFRQASMADQFTSLYNELVESLVPEDQKGSIDHFNFSGYETIKRVEGGINTWDNSRLDFAHLNHVMQTYGKGTVEYKAARYIKTHPEGRKLLLRGDFMSSQGFDAVKTQNQDILKLYNSKKGTGGPKAAFGDVQYMNEVISKNKSWTPEKAYAVGGVRIQSFSDYVPRMVFDYVQMIYDLAATKLPAHAYTKEALFVKQFGLTGVKINMSLIPAIAEGGIAPGLDANGDYVWAGESFDYETAKEIQNAPGYTENCGTICVGVSQAHIEKLLADPDIRMVIPYHKSGLNPIVAHMNKIAAFTDYTDNQRTKGRDGKAIEQDFDFSKAMHDMGDQADPRAVADQYLKWCAAQDYRPRFHMFAHLDGYYKLLEDFTLYDKDGKYVPQREVRAVFPKEGAAFGSMKDLIREGLEEDAVVEGKRDSRLSAIVDEIQKTLPRTEAEIEEKQVQQADRDLEAEVKYSDRDSTGKQLTAEQQEFFKDSKVRNADGNLLRVYHGTNQGKFTVFDWDKTQRADGGFYGRDHYFTAYKGMAERYGSRIVEGYLNIKNPFVWQDEIDGYKEFAVTDVLTKNFAKRINMARVFPKLFANKTMNYGVLDNRTGEMTEKSIKWSDLEKEITKTMGTLKPMVYAGGAVQWSYPGDFWDHQIGDRYESMEEAKRHKFEAAAKAFVETHTGIARYMTYDDQTTWTQDFGSEISDALMEMGYDGAMQNRDGEEIVAFQSNQFKNADNANPTDDPDIRYSDRGSESVSNRALLANAFEGVAKNDIERKRLADYKAKIDQINAAERKLQELNRQIREMTFGNGEKDADALKTLRAEAHKTANRIDTYDRQLLRFEASKPLQNLLDREKKHAYAQARQRGEDARKAYRERSDRTAMRHKIQKVVKELNDLLLNESKKRHVPDSLKKAVAEALSLVNMDTVGAAERIAKYEALIAQETDQDKIDAYTVTLENIKRQGEKTAQRLKELRDAYDEIQESSDPDIANAYDPVIAGSLKELSQSIGDTSLLDMTMEQLSDVYDMYRMVLTRVRDANKAFLNGKKESVRDLASRVVGEVKRTGGEHTYRMAALDPVRSFLWNNLKPVYAFEHLGSSTLTEVFKGVREGEDTWAQDVTEARAYYLDKSKKYGYDKWDFKKKHRFESNSGIPFELTLEQMLSLYAYSKRDQAHDHLRLGGFVFDSSIESYKDKGSKLVKYRVNTADAHQISPEILADIISHLSKDQIGFVDEMQDYLSSTMGAKGNEVTMEMYGVKLFKEKHYFPLKSARQFLFEQNEVSGEVKIKNSGFTNKTVAKANNPIILNNFMDVWSGHVNDMSMYHAFVLPLEDFNRVFNYNSPKSEGQASVSVKGTIQSAYSPAAVHYVKNLITDLNGGARTDSTTGFINKMMGLFKKGAVFASLSVVVQQPSAVARAAALMDTKYFIGPKVDAKRHKALWEEVKQYAPVCIIKEMGYFDTNMGKSTKDFIEGKEYSGFRDKMKALATDSGYRDEVLSKAPALADEIAWCAIWEAVKRETKAQNRGMDTRSEEFLRKAGERFTEVITKTQVYDSVLSRSANMRSKDTGMKMATAFMAEPTTSINMLADALLQGKRGNRKYARKAIGAVIASQILNSILVSFVYAGRDDDEDETYLEKYLGTLSGQIVDSLNPAGYIPFIKDIQSIVQGYDVERSDMAVISDLWNAWKKLGNDNLSVYRKVEGFAGSIAQLFGLPVKNIMRDVRGIYQTVESFMNDQITTKAGIGYAVKERMPKIFGGGTTSNQQQLYEAYLDGDPVQIARVEGRYKDQSAIDSAIRKALREHDTRVWEAAIAWNENDLERYMELAREIIGEGHFSQDNVVLAIRAEADAMVPDEDSASNPKAKGYFNVEKFTVAAIEGKTSLAGTIRADILATSQKNGATLAEAESSFRSALKTELKDLFISGEITRQKATEVLLQYHNMTDEGIDAEITKWQCQKETGIPYADIDDAFRNGEITLAKAQQMYMKYGGMSREDAEDKVAVLEFSKKNPTMSDITANAITKYKEHCEGVGVSPRTFYEAWKHKDGLTGTGDVKDPMLEYINGLNLTVEQKDALYFAFGWAASKLRNTPWHK